MGYYVFWFDEDKNCWISLTGTFGLDDAAKKVVALKRLGYRTAVCPELNLTKF